MRVNALPVSISPDLRIIADRPDEAMTPNQALRFAEQLTLAAMERQAAMMPARRSRRSARTAGNLGSTLKRAFQ